MPFRLMRSKIFLLVFTTLIVVALFVIITTKRNVTHTVIASELHAVENIMDLIIRDSNARWSSLLSDKITTVRNSRTQLMEIGETISSVLKSYYGMVEANIIAEKAAQARAIEWIKSLQLTENRYVFIYNSNFEILATGNQEMEIYPLASIVDFKNRALATAMLEECRTIGYGFAIYRLSLQETSEKKEIRYGYFSYFKPWDWVFVVSDNDQGIIDQVEILRKKMAISVQNNLTRLTLARSGFVFIIAEDGEMIVPLPKQYTHLLDSCDIKNGKSLRAILDDHRENSDQSMLFSDNKNLWYISSIYYRPLKWTLVSAVPKSDLTAPAQFLINRQAIIFITTMLIALVCAWIIAVRIARPLNTLTCYVRSLSEQDLTTEYVIPKNIVELPIKHKDEVGKLAETFFLMNKKLRKNVSILIKEITSKEHFESQLHIARTIQTGLLPIPLSKETLKNFDIESLVIPAKEVGGNFHDYFMLKSRKICIVLGDVSDKGISTALCMAVTRILIREIIENENDPAVILYKINNRLVENNPNFIFVNLLLGILDIDTGELNWANAGLPSPLIIKNYKIEPLDNNPDIIFSKKCGIQKNMKYHSFFSNVKPDEALLVYTKGLKKSANEHGFPYGTARLNHIISLPSRTSAELIQHVANDIRLFVSGTEQQDDVTLLAIRRSKL